MLRLTALELGIHSLGREHRVGSFLTLSALAGAEVKAEPIFWVSTIIMIIIIIIEKGSP
jgi:hypothetical protein